MNILFLVPGVLAIGSGVAFIARRRSAHRNERNAEPRRSYGASGGSGSSGPYYPSGGYDANMNGPYGNSPVAGRDYPSSWRGPNEPGGSLDI